jgi:hypothetical protein
MLKTLLLMTDRNFKFEGVCSGQSDMNETLDLYFDAAPLLCWSIRTPYLVPNSNCSVRRRL